ncbi:proline-serine-threonine phosphatase-interacting protein 1-like [Neocloeon triangulifer]|uniref:proline-serine-threonine phosphatase-interacting protein 1-like n=1 Tax=Neocloeon triangulifer TaxID=2078957 RepID=UPI00286EDCAB|nr:proline-serine-threonine phosphatase-interacting protein 1-like [Neocloeon triangulifer]
MANSSFKNRFWDTELGNFQSYENLIKKIKEDQKGTKEYLEFLRQRVLAEEAHGKALGKLAKISGSRNELGILNGSWQNSHVICADFEVLITKAAEKLNAELDHHQELLVRQVEQRKKEDEEVKEVQQMLKSAMTKLQTKQKSQQAKGKELEKARAALNDMTSGTKDSAKAASALSKAVQQWDSICIAVNQAEEQLEEARSTWEYKMEQAFETLQALQEQRLNALANLQENLVDAVSQQVQLGLSALEVWNRYDEEDVDREMSSFVNRHGNSNERPDTIEQTNFDTSDNLDSPRPHLSTRPDVIATSHPQSSMSLTDIDVGATFNRLKNKIRPALPKVAMGKAPLRTPKAEPRQSLPKADDIMIENTQYVSANTLQVSEDVNGVEYAVVMKKPVPKGRKVDKPESGEYNFGAGASQRADEEEEAVYADLMQGSFVAGGQLYRVMYDYTAKHPTDITLQEGDLVKFISTVSDEWIEVRASNGTQGYFPRNYVEPADS